MLTKIKELSKIRSERKRHYDVCHTKVDVIQSKGGQRCEGWNEELMSPSDVKCIVDESENDNSRNGTIRKAIRGQLLEGKAMKEATGLDMLSLDHDVLVASSRSRFHDVALESEWQEYDDGEQID